MDNLDGIMSTENPTATKKPSENVSNAHEQFESFINEGSNEWYPHTREELCELIKYYRIQTS